ncbi:MAG TPA: prepilin-type N-terminal cleavage/methylation domain-containing protein [Thermoanaerobaculia bacterium]|jgi:general secretion pathway protein G|nr:prepilin-type N-terminal cleavage/methylation domain-containing protein [Thermoanaerobaculia bacterium]
MHRRFREKGFTLIELLIVVAIIGLLAAMLIPNLLDAMQKAKQKKTMADQRLLGGAMMGWLTDEVGAAAAGAQLTQLDLALYTPITAANLYNKLVPTYIQDIPAYDGWKRPYDLYLDTVLPIDVNVMAIRSAGQGGVPAGNTYVSGAFEPTAFDEDLVWADGFFVRWPQRMSS